LHEDLVALDCRVCCLEFEDQALCRGEARGRGRAAFFDFGRSSESGGGGKKSNESVEEHCVLM